MIHDIDTSRQRDFILLTVSLVQYMMIFQRQMHRNGFANSKMETFSKIRVTLYSHLAFRMCILAGIKFSASQPEMVFSNWVKTLGNFVPFGYR